MPKRDLVALSVALFVALMSVIIAKMLFETSAQKAAQKQKIEAASTPKVIERPVEAPTAQVLVAAKDMDLGTALQTHTISWHKWPLDSVIPAYYAKDAQGQLINPHNDPEKMMGKRTRINIAKGMPLMAEMFSEQSDRSVLSLTIRPGMRAVTIPLSPSSTAANILVPGDIVDVYAGDLQAQEGVQIDGVKILALDHQFDPKKNTTSLPLNTSSNTSSFGSIGGLVLQAPKTVTLEVQSSWVAPLLIASHERGATLVLRDIIPDQNHSPLGQLKTLVSKKETKTSDANVSDKTVFTKALPENLSIAGLADAKKPQVVRMIRGSVIQELKFMDGQPVTTSGSQNSPPNSWGGGRDVSVTSFSRSLPPQNESMRDKRVMPKTLLEPLPSLSRGSR